MDSYRTYLHNLTLFRTIFDPTDPADFVEQPPLQPFVVDSIQERNTIIELYGPRGPLVSMCSDIAAFVVEHEATASILRQMTRKLVVVAPFGCPAATPRHLGDGELRIGVLNGVSQFEFGNQQAVNAKLITKIAEKVGHLYVWGPELNIKPKDGTGFQTGFDDLLDFASHLDVLILPAPQHLSPLLWPVLSCLMVGLYVITTPEYYALNQCTAVKVVANRDPKAWLTIIAQVEKSSGLLDKMREMANRYATQTNDQSKSLITRLDQRLR
jgi:hypothetical protein